MTRDACQTTRIRYGVRMRRVRWVATSAGRAILLKCRPALKMNEHQDRWLRRLWATTGRYFLCFHFMILGARALQQLKTLGNVFLRADSEPLRRNVSLLGTVEFCNAHAQTVSGSPWALF